MIYKDDLGALCRRWNWKEADRTKLTPETRQAILVLEGLPPVGVEEVAAASGALAALIKAWCGGAVTTAILDRGRPETELESRK